MPVCNEPSEMWLSSGPLKQEALKISADTRGIAYHFSQRAAKGSYDLDLGPDLGIE